MACQFLYHVSSGSLGAILPNDAPKRQPVHSITLTHKKLFSFIIYAFSGAIAVNRLEYGLG